MSKPTAAETANTIADAAHGLVYAARDIDRPGDAYAVTGGLARTAQVLPQLLQTIHQAVDSLYADGRLVADGGAVTSATMAEVTGATNEAAIAANDLYDRLNALQQSLATLGYQPTP